MTVRSRLATQAPGAGFGLVVLVVFVLLSLGLAGLVTGIDHLPGTGARPELTWAADEAIRPGLDAAARDLAAATADVDDLGRLGRGALAALAASKWDVLDSTIEQGTVLVARIRDRSDALRTRLISLPGLGRNAAIHLSQDSLDRQARLFDAIDATSGLAGAWARLAAGSSSAAQLSTLLTRHDQLITEAIDAGLQSNTQGALGSIDAATATLTQAEALRDRLRNTVDVTGLNEWLRRNRNYDVALRRLYVAAAASPDRVTPELRAASDAEKAARAQLPADTSGLVIIMAEIGRGGLNQAVLAIEAARGSLGAALDAEAAAGESAAPSPAP